MYTKHMAKQYKTSRFYKNIVHIFEFKFHLAVVSKKKVVEIKVKS